ncbi:MAG: helix-turn-helix domain-containing protein [Clostridia bacterium]|nr:helix-turn-helix domain-containing protein [Clostridia bacterium]
MGIGTRLQQLLEKRGMRPGTLAREAGVSKNTVYSMLKRNNAKADGDILARLARVLDVPVSALVADDVPEREMPAHRAILPVSVQRVPLLGSIACGEPILASSADADFSGYTLVGAQIPCDFALRCEGDSMIDARIYDGDIVFIHQQDYVDDGTIAAVLIDDDATLKRVYHLADGRIELRAANARYAPIIIGGENETRNLRILGKAIAFQSNVV